jgi:DNA-binding NtrC family response regulator
VRQRILIIDDDVALGLSCQQLLAAEGYEVEFYSDPHAGLESAQSGMFDVLLIDADMPALAGAAGQVQAAAVGAELVITAENATIESAVEAMKRGAADYLGKPFAPSRLLEVLGQVCQRSALVRQRAALRQELRAHQAFQGIIGRSRPMEQVFTLIKRVAPTEGTVLISGESGTGKEMVSRAIHELSRRKGLSFLACDCTALAPTLLESELFGHVKGSFSGAVVAKHGLFEVANRGTLFLDEVANLSLQTQAKLLRVLESKRVRKVGDTAERDIDIRLIAATNRSLAEMVREGTFREDLYYRLNVVPVDLPPLRDRRGDIPLLALAFLEAACEKMDLKARGFTPETLLQLESYHWPGNVRELRNIVERVVILCDTSWIEPRHLPGELHQKPFGRAAIQVPATWDELKKLKSQLKDAAVRDLECRFLIEALRRCGGNVTKAADHVGIQRTNFHALMRRHGMNA